MDGKSQEETEAEASRRVVEWLSALDKDVFYALKKTQLVTTYGGLVLADAVHAKFPDTTTNIEQIQQLLDSVGFSSPAFAPLNIHHDASLEFGSKWILFKQNDGQIVTKTPFDQLKKFSSSSISLNMTSSSSSSSSSNKKKLPVPSDEDSEMDKKKQLQQQPQSPTSVVTADTPTTTTPTTASATTTVQVEQRSNKSAGDPRDDAGAANKNTENANDDYDETMVPTMELLLLCLRTLHA